MLHLDFSFISLEVIRQYILHGALYTLKLTLVGTIGGIFFGAILAILRLSPYRLVRAPATFYVDTMRSIPFPMVLLWLYLLMPKLLGRPIGAENSAFFTFIAFQSSFFCEIVRSGIQSIPKGQVYASRALGMTYPATLRLIILPQAFRNAIPLLLTQTIILFQDTSLTYVISAYDMLKGFEIVGKNFGRVMESYLSAAIVYFIICFTLSKIVGKIQKMVAIIR